MPTKRVFFDRKPHSSKRSGAARNVNGRVIMYADHMTDSMKRAISETTRRRKHQLEYNAEHGIDPQTISKKIADILEIVRGPSDSEGRRVWRGRKERSVEVIVSDLPRDDLDRLIRELKEEMKSAAAELKFEEAARLRDEINDLQRSFKEAGV